MRICVLLLMTTGLALVAAPAFAQYGGSGMGGSGMGSGMGGGMGGGQGGGGGGHHKGSGQGQKPAATTAAPQTAMHAPANVPLSMRLTGKLVINGGVKEMTHASLASTSPDMSTIYVERNAQLTLDTVDLTGAGDASLVADSRAAGIDSALLVGSAAAVTMTGGHISTTGKGASAAFVSDAGSKLSFKDTALATHASDAYGVEATGGGSVLGDGITVATTGDRGTAVAVQTPNSQAVLTGGQLTTEGAAANAFFVAGTLNASGVTAHASAADGVLADKARNVTLADTSLSAGGYGAVLYAGDEAGHDGAAAAADSHPVPHRGAGMAGPSAPSPTQNPDPVQPSDDVVLHRTAFTMTGGTLKAHKADFYVTNLHAEITLDHVALQSDGGILVRSAADQWGLVGRNGGEVHLITHHQDLTGDFATDVISSIAVSLNDQSTLTGATTPNVDVEMDASSHWVLTGDTNVGKLTDAAIAGDSVPNITGNGHTLTYDHRHNPQLANKTYALAGGGQLVPGGL